MKMRKTLLTILLTLSLCSCGDKTNNNELKSIEIASLPTVTSFYVGEAFNSSGLSVKGIYEDGSSLLNIDYSISLKEGYVFTESDVPNKEVFVTHDHLSTSFSVSVLKRNDDVVIEEDEFATLEGLVITNKNVPIVGEYYDLAIRINNPVNKDNNLLRYISGDTDILTINNDNKLLFYNDQEVTLTIYIDASYNEEYDLGEAFIEKTYKASYPEKITPATDIYVSTTSVDLYINNEMELTSSVLPHEATNKKIRYISSDESVASISEEGLIKTKKAGNITIHTFNDANNNKVLDAGEAFAITFINVKVPEEDFTLTLETNQKELSIGETFSLKPTLTPNPGGSIYYGYSSSNEEVATVYNGTVKAVGPGKAIITTRYSGGLAVAKCFINVKENDDVNNIHTYKVLCPENNIVLEVNHALYLHPYILPSYGMENTLIYKVNNDVVTISQNGLLTAIKEGSSVVNISTSNNKETRVFVTVIDSSNNYATNYYDNYYGNLTWENGQDLKNKLHDIISKDFQALKYNSPNWETNQFADQDLINLDHVNEVYSSESNEKTNTYSSTRTSGWQREHAFAASLLTGFTTGVAAATPGRGTDFHNLFASLYKGNTSRGNKNFGFANKNEVNYVDASMDASNHGDYSYDGKNFEPNDVDKGRLARAIFYMAVMYNDYEDVSVKESVTGLGNKDIDVKANPVDIIEDYVDYNRLSISKFYNAESGTSDAYLRDYYMSQVSGNDVNKTELAYEKYVTSYMSNAIGNRSSLIMWNSFPVDLSEMQHNESVQKHVSVNGGNVAQNNRNPFVDYPELVDYVFGALKDQPGKLSDLKPSYLSLEMDKDEIHNYAYDSSYKKVYKVGETIDKSSFNIKVVKNDLNILDASLDDLEFEPYTFKEEDAGKTFNFTIKTPINDLDFAIRIEAGSNAQASSIEECSYYYEDPFTGSGSTSSKDFYKVQSDGSYLANLNGVNWKVTSEKPVSLKNNQKGTQFGTSSDPCKTLTFETTSPFEVDGKTIINSVFINFGVAANATYKVKIIIDDFTSDIYNIVSSTGILKIPAGNHSGVLSIVVTDITAAIYIDGIGVDLLR